jgi:hypothetical protein
MYDTRMEGLQSEATWALFDNSTLVSHSDELRPCHLSCLSIILFLSSVLVKQGNSRIFSQLLFHVHLIASTNPQARRNHFIPMQAATSTQARKRVST